jgi:hypothetical protein
MKSVFILFCSFFFTATVLAQTPVGNISVPDSTKKIQAVQVACGSCKFGLAGKDCAMAVWIKGKAYYVDGADIDGFGDAHAHDGMCNAVRKAEVQGELVNNRFKISYIRLLPQKNKGK